MFQAAGFGPTRSASPTASMGPTGWGSPAAPPGWGSPAGPWGVPTRGGSPPLPAAPPAAAAPASARLPWGTAPVSVPTRANSASRPRAGTYPGPTPSQYGTGTQSAPLQSWAPPYGTGTQSTPLGAGGQYGSSAAFDPGQLTPQQFQAFSQQSQTGPIGGSSLAPTSATVAAKAVTQPLPQAASPQPSGRSYVPTPLRDSRIRTLNFNDRQGLACGKHLQAADPMKSEKTPADVAGGNKALEYALQVILNMQALDSELLGKAILSHKDGSGGMDALALMQRLQEMGPRLVTSEERISQTVRGLNSQDTVNLLKDLGLDDQALGETLASHSNLGTVHDDIIQVLKKALPADTLAEAVSMTVEHRLKKFLKGRGVTRYSDNIISLRHEGENWASVWQRLWLEYPSRPLPAPLAPGCEHRSDMRVLIIGPGFGLLATPHMIDLVRGAGYQLLELPELPNLETLQDPAQIQSAVRRLQDQIARFQPHVVCAASKGGLYFNHLWTDPNWTTSCVLINAHPNITQLPKNAAVVVTQGSKDDTFKRIVERATLLIENEQVRDGVAAKIRYCQLRAPGDSPALVVQQSFQVPCIGAGGSVQMSVVPAGAVLKPDVTMFGSNMNDPSQIGYSHLTCMEDLTNLKTPASISYRTGREDLEDLARTGTPMKSLLYLSCSGISVRPGKAPGFTRNGDAHAAPESLCHDDCLPRLIDAAASGRPEDSLHESWAMRSPEERRAGETFIGHDPQTFRRFWTGDVAPGGSGRRVPVPPVSDEFFAVEQMFRSNPEDKNYQFGHDWAGKKIVGIDRVQAPGQLEAIDSYYASVRNNLSSQGTRFVNGVHTRWLFHGSRAIDSIISDEVNGFKTTLSKTTMWGVGSYFARDAQYPDDHGFFGEPRPDGTKDMLMCLVVTGMSVLGDEAYAIKPYRHGTQHRYHSFVDSLSNPEIFVVNTSRAVLPAYVITYA